MNMKKLLSSILWSGFLATANIPAPTLDIDWFTVAGGGGNANGGNFSVSATIGQAMVGSTSGGNFGLEAGFWSATTGPGLSISRSGAKVTISWPSPSTGYI